jgi:hypothetical protein
MLSIKERKGETIEKVDLVLVRFNVLQSEFVLEVDATNGRQGYNNFVDLVLDTKVPSGSKR